MNLKPGISSFVPVRNGNSLDYCWQLAVKSLVPISDEVIISDGGSTDGTKEEALELAKTDSRIRVVDYDWGNPHGDLQMLPRWLNHIRTNHCRFDYQLTLDADEVLCSGSYDQIRRLAAARHPAWYSRLNFWGDPYHIAPHGTVCAHVVVRSGPTEWETVSDGFYNPEPPIKVHAVKHPSLRIFHLGFLRKEAAFHAKSKVVQNAILGTCDPVFDKAKAQGVPWHTLAPFKQPLQNYSGGYPADVAAWLTERGYNL